MRRKYESPEPMYEMARVIAGSMAKRLRYREDIVSEAYIAIAEGATNPADIQNTVRKSLRREWKRDNNFSPLEIADSLMRVGAPERARVDLWGAVATLTERQQAVVVMTFWEGMTAEEIAAELKIPRRTVADVLERAIRALKIYFFKVAKTGDQNALGK